MPTAGTVTGQTDESFDQFSFTNVSLDQIDGPTLSKYDTVVLMQVNTSDLSDSAKQALAVFVTNGGKLIIHDADGTTGNDYSWLLVPASTGQSCQNCGATTGTSQVIENNTMVSANPADPAYVAVSELEGNTDAVGDANVMITQDPRWFVDIRATTSLGDAGAVHTYASDNGLIIFDGYDTDSVGQTEASGIDWLAKLWYSELAQGWNPDGLPHGVPIIAPPPPQPPPPPITPTSCSNLHQLKSLSTDKFSLRSSVPGPLDFPVGVDVTPGIGLAASVTNLTIRLGGNPEAISVQAVNPAGATTILATVDPATFGVSAPGASPTPSYALFSGSPSPAFSFGGTPSFSQDNRANFPLSPLVQLPIVTAGVDQPALSTSIGGAVITLCLDPSVGLHLRFYPFQAAVYALTRAAENLAGDLATGGIGAPVIAAIVEAQIASNAADRLVDLAKLISVAQGKWGAAKLVAKLQEQVLKELTTKFEGLLKGAVGAGVGAIGAQLNAAAKYFKDTVVVALKSAIVRPITITYDGARWVFDKGGTLVNLATRSVESARNWTVDVVKGWFSAVQRRRVVRFDVLPVQLLRARVTRHGSAGLGVGFPRLNRLRATSVAQVLMQHGADRVRIQSLLVSRNAPQVGGGFRIAGARLGAGKYVAIELRGPGYAAQRLIAAKGGVAAADLTLPATLTRGTWTVGLVNYTGAAKRRRAVCDAYQWQVHGSIKKRKR